VPLTAINIYFLEIEFPVFLTKDKHVEIATSINMICSYGTTTSIKAKMHSNSKMLKQWQECTLTRLCKAGNFELNAQLLMALQQCGQGEDDAAVYAGMLNFSVSPIHAGWTRLEEEIGLKEIQLRETIINKNIKLERKMMMENMIGHNNTAAGRVGLLVQGDTRWDHRSSGHAYNSDSGASILVGNQLCMSKRCRKCKLGHEHASNLCPKNYEGSSKGMEAVGALRKIWEKQDVSVGTYVMDDDSTTRAVLCHPYKEMLRLGRMTKAKKPKRIAKNPKHDSGQLWMDHPIILPLADKNHQGKHFAKTIFQLANAPNAVSTASKNDADQRIKWNFNFWCLYWHETEEMFKWRSNAVIEHHFNNHR
jgi:hypothetical protein